MAYKATGSPLKSFTVMIVEAGEEIEVLHPVTQQPETHIMTDDEAVYVGRNVYMTGDLWEKMKAELDGLSPDMKPGWPQ